MGPGELLEQVAERLGKLDLPYFVTGSMATIAYGEPRFTNDIDIVVRLANQSIAAFVQAFAGDEFYLAEETVVRAVKSSGSFNLIHPSSGLKVDFMVAARTDFNRSRFQRVRQTPTGHGSSLPFASPEDVILKKLEFFREGGSEKHLRDIAGVLRVMNNLDRKYLAKWAVQLGVAEELSRILDEVDQTTE